MEDHSEMLKFYFRWLDAILDAIQKSQELPSLTKPSLLAIIGMEGSAIGGDLLRDLLYNQFNQICRYTPVGTITCLLG